MSKQEDRLKTVKNEIRGLLISSPTGLNVQSLLREYRTHIGKPLSVNEFGFNSFYDFFESVPDILLYDRNSDILIPVNPTKSKHINSLVSHQKSVPGNKKIRRIPRRSTAAVGGSYEPRIPVQLPLDSKMRGGYTCGSQINNSYLYENRPANGYSHDFGRKVEEFFKRSYEYEEDLEPNYDQPCEEEMVINGKVVNDVTAGPISPPIGSHGCSEDDTDISDKLKENLRVLVEAHPEGLISSKLRCKYKERYGYDLQTNYQDIKELVLALPTVFRYEHVKPGNEWLLFSTGQMLEETSGWVAKPLMDNMSSLAQDHPNGIPCKDIPALYRLRFGQTIILEHLNFDSIESLVIACKTVKFVKKGLEGWMYPLDLPFSNPGIAAEKNHPLLPSLSQISFLWKSKFRDDECDPTENYKPFDIPSRESLKYKKVCVCDVITPNNIWLQFDDQVDELQRLMYKINEFYNDKDFFYTLESYCIVEGLMCTVRFSMDKRWHRAKIIKIESSQIEVQYVDYGTIDKVDASSLRKLVKEFSTLPVQAVQTTLHNLIPAKHTDWQTDDIDFIYQLTYDKKFHMEVLKINPSDPKLEIVLHTEDSTINDMLLYEGIAVHKGFVNIDTSNSPMNTGVFPADMNNLSIHLSPPVLIEKEEKPGLDNRPRIRTPPGYPSKNSISHSISDFACSYLKDIADILGDRPSNFKEMSDLLFAVSKKVHELGVEIRRLGPGEESSGEAFDRNPLPPPVGLQIPVSPAPAYFPQQAQEPPHYPAYPKAQGMPLFQGGNMLGFPSNPFVHGISMNQQGSTPMSWAARMPHLPSRPSHPYMNFPSQVPFPNQNPRPYHFPSGESAIFPGNSQMTSSVGPRLPAHLPPYSQAPSQVPPVPNKIPSSCLPQVPPGPPYQGSCQELSQVPNQMPLLAASQAPLTSIPPLFPHSSQIQTQAHLQSLTKAPSQCSPKESYAVPNTAVNTSFDNYQQLNSETEVDECSRVSLPEVQVSSSEVSVSDSTTYNSFISSGSNSPSSSQPPQAATTLVESPGVPALTLALKKSSVTNGIKHSESRCIPKPIAPLELMVSKECTCKEQIKEDHSVYSNPTEKMLKVLLEKNDPRISISNDLASGSSEHKKLEDAITERIHLNNQEPVNSFMRILVRGPFINRPCNVHLLLVKNSVAVLLEQLLENYSDLDYKTFTEKYGDSGLGVYSIFYTEYTFLFNSLRKERLISDDDIILYVVNLEDVSPLLQCISNMSYTDLQKVCDTFKDVCKDVPVDDGFWWTKKD